MFVERLMSSFLVSSNLIFNTSSVSFLTATARYVRRRPLRDLRPVAFPRVRRRLERRDRMLMLRFQKNLGVEMPRVGVTFNSTQPNADFARSQLIGAPDCFA